MNNIAIFGATSDIAKHTALQLAAPNVHFTLVARDPARLAKVAEQLQQKGAKVTQFQTDLSDNAQHVAALQAAIEGGHSLDLALIAFGSLTEQTIADSDPSYLAKELSLNFNAPIHLMRHLLNQFERQNYGTLAVISSVAGDRIRRSNYAYGVCKQGLSAYLIGAREQYRGSQVRLLDIRPGMVSSKMTAHLEQGPLFAQAESVGRDIAKAIRSGQQEIYTPGFWRIVMWVIRCVPSALLTKLKI